MFIDLSITIRKIINATLAMVFRLLFSVVLNFFLGAKRGKESVDTKPAETAETKIGK